jgi:uncharacterized protein (TIGR02145 family)
MRNHDNNNHVIAALLNAGVAISISVFFAACGDDSNKTSGGSVEDQEVIAITDKTVSGVSQKGPFVNGSSITVQELDGGTLAQTGLGFEGKIKNDLGEFSIKVKSLQSQYALLKANGFYRNEVTGEKSKSQVTLYALTDLSDRDEVNVNLLTHLEYERSLYLATDESLSVASAKKQAESEVLTSFGIRGEFANAEDLSIFGNGDENAALLAISILMQGELSEADFSERLNNYATDIEADGKWDDVKTATKIADWASENSLNGGLSKIRSNIVGWDLASDVPPFEKYVNNFWWEKYGLGVCNDEREGEVLKNDNSLSGKYDIYFICEKNTWRIASDTEYDTYQQKCDEDGKIVFGNINKDYSYDCDVQRWRHASNVEAALGGCVEKRFDEVAETEGVYYICQNREWRKATDVEKDTYGWEIGNDADVKYGDVVKTNCYVFEDSVWRSGKANDCLLGLRGCTALRQDTIGEGSDDVWYKCDAKSWREAIDIEKDTYGWKSGVDSDTRNGDIVKENCYVFEDSAWRSGNTTDCSLGLRGCTALRQDTVGEGGDGVWYKCASQTWRKATDIEKDTAKWGAGEFDGEIRVGQVNKTIYYIYETDKKAWRKATTLEKDTYDHKNNKDWIDGADGEIKKGSITDTIYVFDATIWRIADDVEKVLGGCVTEIQDSVGKVKDTYYICESRSWVVATVHQYDLYRHECSEFGQIVHGNVNVDYVYFCYGEEWKRFYGNENITYGKLVDERDGQIYRTVKIGNQTWMAENLNYADDINYPSMLGRNWSGAYGRLYTWSAVIDSVYWVKQGMTCGYAEDADDLQCSLPENVQGICPEGWHVPSGSEMETLYSAMGNDYQTVQAKGFPKWKKATDEYGFSALPNGLRYRNGDSDYTERAAFFWGTEYSYESAYMLSIYWDSAGIGSLYKHAGLSVRCIKDE